MRTLYIRKGYRIGNMEVVGKHFGDFEVIRYDEENNPSRTVIVTGAEIRSAAYEEVGKFYGYVVFEDD